MPAETERRFRAMGADAHLVVVGGVDRLLDDAQRRIEQLEHRWSRFIDSSEICELNHRAGDAVVVSADTRMLVERAVEAWRLTGGGFDPTVLGAVLRAGYDISFDEMSDDRSRPTSALITGCNDIRIDDRAVCLPRGSGFDPGGIGKGLAADLVIDELLAAGVAGACVNLGGDLRVAGCNPKGEAWTIAIEHPWIDEPIGRVGLHSGAVATSTTLRRRWSIDGQPRHHLIDPDTGEPSESDLELTTVIAAEAWIAEVMAKAVLLRGSARAFDIVDDTRVQALTIDDSGDVRTTPGFARFVGDMPLPAQLNQRRTVEAQS
jgi:thiamine biosynthesis lipoprotein